MRTSNPSNVKLLVTKVTMVAVTVACLVILAAGTNVADAQDSPDVQQTPYLDDWTSHHLVFSDSGTKEEAGRR